MQYIKVDDGVWISYDPKNQTSSVVVKSTVEDQLAFNEKQLEDLPKPVTDEELLDWAKSNYPQSGTEQSRLLIQKQIDDLKLLLEQLT